MAKYKTNNLAIWSHCTEANLKLYAFSRLQFCDFSLKIEWKRMSLTAVALLFRTQNET